MSNTDTMAPIQRLPSLVGEIEPVPSPAPTCNHIEGFRDLFWRCKELAVRSVIWIDGSKRYACGNHWPQLRHLAIRSLCRCPSGSYHRGDLHDATCPSSELEMLWEPCSR